MQTRHINVSEFISWMNKTGSPKTVDAINIRQVFFANVYYIIARLLMHNFIGVETCAI